MKDLKKKDDKKGPSLSKLEIILLIFYFIIVIALALTISFDESLKKELFHYLTEIRNNLSLKWYFILFGIGVILTIIGFPIAMYELSIGYILESFFVALFLDISFKMIGVTVIFLTSRYLFKAKITILFEDSIIFKTIQRGIKKNAFKSAILIKLSLMPHLLKNYGMGITEIPLLYFLIASLIASIVYGTIWIYFGSNMKDLFEAISFHQTNDTYIIVRYCLIGVSIAILIVVIIYSIKYFGEIKKEVEEEEKLLNLNEKKEDYGTIKELQST